MQPTTEYGNSYYLYPFGEDKNEMNFEDQGESKITFDPNTYSL